MEGSIDQEDPSPSFLFRSFECVFRMILSHVHDDCDIKVFPFLWRGHHLESSRVKPDLPEKFEESSTLLSPMDTGFAETHCNLAIAMVQMV